MQPDKVRDALNRHNSNFLYEQLISVGEEGKRAIIELCIDEFLDKALDGDDEGADTVLLSLVHSSVSPSELGLAIYNRGKSDWEPT